MCKQSDKKTEIKINPYKLNFKSIFLIGFIFVIMLIFWVLGVVKLSWIDLTKTGQIGDTIGGVTAPVIGLAGAILVYVSFQAQLKANQMQFDALIAEKVRYRADRFFDIKYRRLEQIKSDFRNIYIMYPKKDGLEHDYIKLSDTKEEIIRAIENDLKNKRVRFDNREAFDLVSLKLMTVSKLSKYASFEIFTFLTKFLNLLIDVNNEVSRISINNDFESEKFFLMDCYDDLIKSDFMPIINMFVKNKKMFEENDERINNILEKIIANIEQIKSSFDS